MYKYQHFVFKLLVFIYMINKSIQQMWVKLTFKIKPSCQKTFVIQLSRQINALYFFEGKKDGFMN